MTGRFSFSGRNINVASHVQFPESLQNGLFFKMQFWGKTWAQVNMGY